MKQSTEELVTRVLTRAGITINGPERDSIHVNNPLFYERVFTGRELGLGESYMDGWWDCDHIDEAITKLLKIDIQSELKISPSLAAHFARSVLSNRQNISRAAMNADHHYNIGNELYSRMLDSEMVYSCGYWKNATDLDSAQIAKLDLICRKLKLEPGMKLLDIGSGWGALLRHAVRNYGVQGYGISPAENQISLARELSDGLHIKYAQQDYRNLSGKFERVVSVGMMEHVGPKNYRKFFKKTSELLTDDGIALHHTIVANKPIRSTNQFIDRYIFPGGVLPSLEGIAHATSRRLIIEDVQNFGPDYDRTLMAWHSNINQHWSEIPHFDMRFQRMWNFYLLICAAAFRARNINLMQIVFRPAHSAGRYDSVR